MMACRLVGIKPLSEPNAGILLIRSLGIYFSEILIEIHTFSLKKIHLKMSSVKRRQFCLGLDMLYAIDLALWYWCSFHNIRSTKLRLSDITEALKGHRVVWKIEISYLTRMTYEWKSMSSGWHNNIVVTHPDEIPISAKSSGWHMVVWYVIRMTYCSVQKSSGWDTARS